MKICYLADAANVHTQKWARFFVESGNTVHVISFRPATIDGAQVHHIQASFARLGYLLAANRVRKLVWRIAPDILHAHHATSYGLVGALSGYHPFLLSSWGSDVVWSPQQFFLFDWMLRYNFKHADRVTATSQMLAKVTASFCPPGTKVHVIPFGVDTNVFSPPSNLHSGTGRPLTVGIVKALRPRYGIRELILAFHRMADTFPNAQLVIVGGGEQYAELQALVVNLGLERRITLAGQAGHEQVPKYLQSFDLFVVPSLTDRESFGVAAVEASACGLPVIASRVGGLPEVVLDGETGLLVPPGDVDALAAAMSRLLSGPELRTKMGQAGRQFVLEHYCWEDNAKLMEQLYEEVLGNRGYDGSSPFVSIVIPMRNEGDHIRSCLEAVLAQDYPMECMEILVVDGRSTDYSRDVVTQYAQRHSHLRLLDNPRRITSAALNVGIQNACGRYIVRVDAHTVIAADYVRQCVTLLEATGAANVGGQMRPVGQTYMGQAVALSTTSPFGVGDAWFHYDAREQFVDTVYMGAFRREVFDLAGLFDEELVRNQDYELNVRIRKSGGKILLSPRIVSHYVPRSSLPALWRQYFQYGRWKVRTLQKHPDSLRWRQALPPLFVSVFFGSLGLGLLWPPAGWLSAFVAGCYLLANLAASTIAAGRGGWRYLPLLPIIFATIHFAWGLGFLYGVARIPVPPRKPKL